MANSISIDDIQPDTVIRIGLRSAGAVGHTYRLYVHQVTPLPGSDRVRLEGHRLTLAGRPVEHVNISVACVDLRPDLL
jgi:hypothetical protein